MPPPATLEPIRAHKAGWVLIAPDRIRARFAGLSVHLPYSADDVAGCAPERCRTDGAHDAPDRDGSCGFHGTAQDPISWLVPDAALLDVELFGRVVRHERGWRASRQRVLGAAFLRACRECRGPAAMLVALPSDVVDGWWTVGARCLRCVDAFDDDAISPAHLAGLLGTEVSWADEPTTSEALRYLRAA
jgi:hypothetical protein